MKTRRDQVSAEGLLDAERRPPAHKDGSKPDYFMNARVAVLVERRRLEDIHGDESMASMRVGPWQKLAILMEEVGEVAQNLNERSKGDADTSNLIEEVCQVSAASLAWLECLLRARDESRSKLAVHPLTLDHPFPYGSSSGLPLWSSEAAERSGYASAAMPFAFADHPRTATRAETLEAASAEAFLEYQAKTGQRPPHRAKYEWMEPGPVTEARHWVTEDTHGNVDVYRGRFSGFEFFSSYFGRARFIADMPELAAKLGVTLETGRP